MKKVLFATKNPAKIATYYNELTRRGIEVITLKDLSKTVTVEETGKTVLENAHLKAKAYYDLTGIPTVALDNGLYLEGVPEDKQPGLFVRRVNGKELTDDEMIEHYQGLLKEYGKDGKLFAKWIFGFAICNGKEEKEYEFSEGEFYFIEKLCDKRTKGFPLDSMSISVKDNKYLVEQTEEDRADLDEWHHKEVVDFIENNI